MVMEAAVARLRQNIIILFDITDIVTHRNISRNSRVAWGFLKPTAKDGTSNTERAIRLQLFSPRRRRRCRLDHTTCDVFHLYSAHKRKLTSCSLWVTVKAVKMSTGQTPEPLKEDAEESRTEEGGVEEESQAVVEPVIQWSRLPGQTCKVPNVKKQEVHVGRQGVSSVCFNRSGTQLALATLPSIRVYNVVTSEEIATLAGHSGLVYQMEFSQDDGFLLSVSADATALVWSVGSSTPTAVLPHPSFVYCCSWLDSTRLVTGCKDFIIRCWTCAGERFELTEEVAGHGGFVSALLADGKDVLVSGDSVGCVMVRRFQTNTWVVGKKLVLSETMGRVIDALHVHTTRRRILVTARSRGPVLVDVLAGVVVQSYKAAFNLYARSVSCLSPCGSLVISFCQNNVLNVWETHTGKLLATYDTPYPNRTMSEQSGLVAYHPHDHIAVVAMLATGHPALLLEYNSKHSDAEQLGLIMHQEVTKVKQKEVSSVKVATSTSKPAQLDGDKLASLVRTIDNVLAAKHVLTSGGNSFESC